MLKTGHEGSAIGPDRRAKLASIELISGLLFIVCIPASLDAEPSQAVHCA